MEDNLILKIGIIVVAVFLSIVVLYFLYKILKIVFDFILRFISEIVHDCKNFKNYIKSVFKTNKTPNKPPHISDEDYQVRLLLEASRLYKLDCVFNKSEQYLYYILTSILKDYKDFILIPKIRIVDFIHITENNQYKNTEPLYYNKFIKGQITSKHVDFLICKKQGELRETNYMPYLAIEFFGPNHQTNQITINSDKFKSELFRTLDLPLILFNTNDIELNTYESKINISNKISPFLREKENQHKILF